MIPVSSAFRSAVAGGKRDFTYIITITLADNTVLTVGNADIWQRGLVLEDAVSGDSDFQVGAAVIGKATIVLNNMYGAFSAYDFRLAEVFVSMSLALANNTTETINKGVYIVNDAVYTDPLITLECYDNMFRLEQPYSLDTTVFPATLATIVRNACADCDVTLATQVFPNSTLVIPTKPDSKATTYREVVSWCAQLAGCFARCNRSGALELKWFDASAFADTSDGSSINRLTDIFKPEVSMDEVVVTGVRITVDTEDNAAKEYQTGAAGYLMAISGNPLITEDNVSSVLSFLGTQLIGFRFWKARVPHLADPVIEAGDTAVFWDRLSQERTMFVTKTVFTSGDRQVTTCSAQDPARNSATRYSESTKNYVKLRELIHDEKSDREQAYTELSQRINSTSGLYTTLQTGTSGTVYYLHNKPLLADSDIVWKMTSEAWAVSTDGGTTWNAGVTVDGTVIANILSTIGLNFNWGVGGQLTIEDQQGNETLFVDADTGVVRINATSFSLSGNTINTIAQNAVDGLKIGGRNLFINTLSPSLTKLPRALEQTADTYVLGTASVAEHGLRSTAPSAGRQPQIRFGDTTTSVFDMTCMCLEPGETYTWSADASWKAMSSATGLANANTYYIRAYCYYFKNGGTAYTSMYTDVCEMVSANRGVDMSMRLEYTFTLPSDAIGAYLSFLCNAPSGNFGSGDYVELANLKLEKGTKASAWTPAPEDLEAESAALADAAEASAIAEAAALAASAVSSQTQQDIFNKLTNNGTIQGIYMQNGQLYISFTYAKGGTLKLGGTNNGNGLMEIYDASNNLIGSWGKDGLVANTGGRIESANGRVYFDLTNNELACSTLRSPTTPGTTETVIKTGESSQWVDNVGVILGDLTYVNICRAGYESNGLMISPTASSNTLIRSYRGMELLTSYGTEPFVSLSLGLTEFTLLNAYESSIRSAYKTVYFGDTASDELGPDLSTNVFVYGTIGATGTKSRIVKTEDYGTRRLYCYETPTPLFGDVGEGVVGKDGLCRITIDPVLAETLADSQYQVFLQAYGDGAVYVADRKAAWFDVHGTPGLAFGWEIKARQRDYDSLRLEKEGLVGDVRKTDYAAEAVKHIAGIAAERTAG